MTEETQKDSKLLDSSIWLGYFLDGDFTKLIESESFLYLSVLSLFEVERKLNKSSLKKEELEKGISFMRSKSIVLDLTEKEVNLAIKVAIEKNLPSIDSMIYATALSNNLKIYTKDNDFRNLPEAFVL